MKREDARRHPGTFNANPLSAATGAAALAIVAQGEENMRADEAGRHLREGMNAVLVEHQIPGCVSGGFSLLHLRLGQECFQDCGDRRRVCTPSSRAALMCNR
jgi:glutamate-1-semialdehyde 2,1-aminomutase